MVGTQQKMQDQPRKDSVELRKRWPPPTKKKLAHHEKTVPSSFNKLKGARTMCNQNYQSHQNRRKLPDDADAILVFWERKNSGKGECTDQKG